MKWLKSVRNLSYAFKYLLDPKVSFFKKALIIGALLYVIMPFDLLPDPVFGFGFIDDGLILLFALIRLMDQLENYIKSVESSKQKTEHEDENVIDGIEYEVYDEKTDKN